jgi:hypothetical protein
MLLIAKSLLAKATEGVPIGVRLLVSTVPIAPKKTVALGWNAGGGQTVLVVSVSPTQVDAETCVTTSAFVNWALVQFPTPMRPMVSLARHELAVTVHHELLDRDPWLLNVDLPSVHGSPR